MKNAIILHGMPDKEEYLAAGGDLEVLGHWIIWLQDRLVEIGIKAEVPKLPEPYDPKYEKWKSVFEGFQISPDTILVGHSCGAGFLIRWLSENKLPVGKVVLVAPWIDPTKEFTKDMFDFVINPDIANQCEELTIMYSKDDDDGVLQTVRELKSSLSNANYKEFLDKGHFTLEDMGTTEFPEILEVLRL